MREPIIKAGDKYNRLTAVRFDHRNKHGSQYWLFKCDCENEKIIRVSSVKNNSAKSCGCLHKEIKTTHGMSHSNEYHSWASMKQRCLNKKNSHYKNWGGRGIKICKRWMKFENFYKDMGERLEGTTLDRIDNNKGYLKENCRWATAKEQLSNTRRNHLLTYNGRTMTVTQWASQIGISRMTLHKRVKKGWSIKRALTT